jgi:hypothetical protein
MIAATSNRAATTIKGTNPPGSVRRLTFDVEDGMIRRE